MADTRLPGDMVMHYDSDLREYRVTFMHAEIARAFVRLALPIPTGALRERAEAIAYYTNDRRDAVDTARDMSARSSLRGLVGEEQWTNVTPTRIGIAAADGQLPTVGSNRNA